MCMFDELQGSSPRWQMHVITTWEYFRGPNKVLHLTPEAKTPIKKSFSKWLETNISVKFRHKVSHYFRVKAWNLLIFSSIAYFQSLPVFLISFSLLNSNFRYASREAKFRRTPWRSLLRSAHGSVTAGTRTPKTAKFTRHRHLKSATRKYLCQQGTKKLFFTCLASTKALFLINTVNNNMICKVCEQEIAD